MEKTGPMNFRRGIAQLAVLSLLRQKDMYGYQIAMELERQSDRVLQFQEGSLYPVLYRLADCGYLSSYEQKSGPRMTRTYYHLEPDGAALLERLSAEYKSVTQAMLQVLSGENAEV